MRKQDVRYGPINLRSSHLRHAVRSAVHYYGIRLHQGIYNNRRSFGLSSLLPKGNHINDSFGCLKN